MREAGEDGWEMLQQYFHHLAGEWTFFPAEGPIAGASDPMLRDVLARPPLAELVLRWDELAAHQSALRRRLAELAEARDVAASFLPPALPVEPDDDTNPEAGIPDLLLDARRTWTALAAIAWVCGASEVARPTAAAITERADALHGWTGAMLASARAVTEGEDPGASLTWGRQALSRYDPQFTGITLVALFEHLAEIAAWLVGAEPPMIEDEDEDPDAPPDDDA